MVTNELFAIGTLATWTGWLLGVRGLLLGMQLLLNAPGTDKLRAQRGLVFCLIAAGILLASSAALPMKLDRAFEAGIHVPLVWFVMPASAWAGVALAVYIVSRVIQAWLALNSTERTRMLRSAGFAFVALVAVAWLYRLDPANRVTILKGAMAFSVPAVCGIALLAVAAAFCMIMADRMAKTRGIAKVVGVQLALLAGSVVFGIPFVFLLVTSFKEDRDMSSPNGIVWIPRVTEQLPYKDPKRMLYQATWNGQTVDGTLQSRASDGTVRIDVEKPFSLAGTTFQAPASATKEIPRMGNVLTASLNGTPVQGLDVEDLDNGSQRVRIMEPGLLKGTEHIFLPSQTTPVRHVGLRWQNYPEALSYLPIETNSGLLYLRNTLLIVVMSVLGTVLSSSLVAYGFSRMKFPGRNTLFFILLSTMMLPGAVTLMPQFLIFRSLGWIDTLYPLWVPAFFASAFNVFLLRQFFMQIPMELEDAAKIDGASYARTFWQVMLPQIKPALAVIAIWTFMGAWNNFMGPLIYINSPENMPLSYALQLFQGDRSGEPGLLMAFATLTMIPVLLLFFFAQRYFIEGVTLSGLGGR